MKPEEIVVGGFYEGVKALSIRKITSITGPDWCKDVHYKNDNGGRGVIFLHNFAQWAGRRVDTKGPA